MAMGMNMPVIMQMAVGMGGRGHPEMLYYNITGVHQSPPTKAAGLSATFREPKRLPNPPD
jgi:hypothetical protein